VADAAIEMIRHARAKHETDNAVLSGGVFMNKILTETMLEKIPAENLGEIWSINLGGAISSPVFAKRIFDKFCRPGQLQKLFPD